MSEYTDKPGPLLRSETWAAPLTIQQKIDAMYTAARLLESTAEFCHDRSPYCADCRARGALGMILRCQADIASAILDVSETWKVLVRALRT